jgi:hypothetical protein
LTAEVLGEIPEVLGVVIVERYAIRDALAGM